MRIRNKVVTLEDQLSAVDTQARGALDVFEKAAQDLDAAAQAAQDVLDAAEAEVVRLRLVRDDAFRQVASVKAKAEKIREFAK